MGYGMDDEDDLNSPLAVGWQPSANQLAGIEANDSNAQFKYDKQLAAQRARWQQGEEAIRARRAPGLGSVENLLALSAAFFSPTRTRNKFAGMMQNVLPVVQGAVAQQRTAKDEQEDLLRKYGLQVGEMELGAAKDQMTNARQLLTSYLGAASKGRGSQGTVVSDPMGNRFNNRTGFAVPNAQQVNALISNPYAAQDFDLKFGPGAAQRILQQYGGQR